MYYGNDCYKTFRILPTSVLLRFTTYEYLFVIFKYVFSILQEEPLILGELVALTGTVSIQCRYVYFIFFSYSDKKRKYLIYGTTTVSWSLGTHNLGGLPVKVNSIFNTVIGLSHLCCHSVLYFLNKLSVIFLTQLHHISELLQNVKHPS